MKLSLAIDGEVDAQELYSRLIQMAHYVAAFPAVFKRLDVDVMVSVSEDDCIFRST